MNIRIIYLAGSQSKDLCVTSMNFFRSDFLKHLYQLMKNFTLLFALLLFLASCSSSKRLTRTEKQLNEKIFTSSVFEKGFSGFAIFDPETNEYLYESNSKKHFTPASNMKILTYYISSKILGDSIPAIRYFTTGDSLIFFGTGDPTFLNSNFSENTKVLDFLKNRKEKLFFSNHNFDDDYLGKGWMWDDYPYAFQPQKSGFPIYGNVAEFSIDSITLPMMVRPNYFKKYILADQINQSSRPNISRSLSGNEFMLNQPAFNGKSYSKKVPFDYSERLVMELLSEKIGKKGQVISLPYFPKASSTVFATATDSLYKKLLQSSDNFVAEQLLLLCSEKQFGIMNTARIIKAATDSFLIRLPQKAILADGSGLSRYSKITPQSLVFVLNEIYKSTPFEKIKHLFPTGGVNGTIEDWYAGTPPYVFAKTGTLSGVHNLSGYVQTNSGKTLIFSFMHNNYIISSSEYKKEMQLILEWINNEL